MPISAFSRASCLLLSNLAASVAYADYQPVISLSCADGNLLIEARPYRAKGAGYSSVTVRYRYLGIELTALHPDSYGYPDNIVPYLEKANPYAYDAGLFEAGNGHWQAPDYPAQGETLFLPPTQFTEQQVSRLAACIYPKQRELSMAFSRAKIKGRTSAITGLEAGIALDGIAFLMHADFPLADIYSNEWQVLLIEQGGRVLLHNHYAGTEAAPEIRLFGQVLPSQQLKGRAKLRLHPLSSENTSDKNDKKEWVKKLESLTNRRGERFVDNYQLLFQ